MAAEAVVPPNEWRDVRDSWMNVWDSEITALAGFQGTWERAYT
jgi:hypothetical protein